MRERCFTSEVETLGLAALAVHAGADLVHLGYGCHRGRTGALLPAYPPQTLPGLVVAALLGEPPRALGQGEHAETQQRGRDELQADGDLPLRGAGVGNAARHGVIYPVAREDALPDFVAMEV